MRIGWFGDDFELWKITAADDAVSTPRWTATFNHVTPAEIVAGLTSALARDYTEAKPHDGQARFLASPSPYWADAVRPLTDAGWRREAAERGTVELISPGKHAGVLIDNRPSHQNQEAVTLWAGPPGWGTRAEAVFSARTPTHLIAATAAAMVDPTPAVRERHQLSHELANLATLTPVNPSPVQVPRAPTPLDVRRTAVTQAVQRAARSPRTAAELRVVAARSRSAIPGRTRSSAPALGPGAGALRSSATPRRNR
ncbi:DUF317 domain-containing protein [Streptacidiphilus sp. BW17]|uniref:DUF317 domain-containing protein n=1 Tax=Streptacidiphilus sp. BW17 TaxID=3156274 RepID=UPI003515C782